MSLKPALAPVLASIILGDKLAFNTIIGILLIATGPVITFQSNSKKQLQSIINIDLDISPGEN